MEAQLVERSTENRKVGGSSPLRGVNTKMKSFPYFEFVAQW